MGQDIKALSEVSLCVFIIYLNKLVHVVVCKYDDLGITEVWNCCNV